MVHARRYFEACRRMTGAALLQRGDVFRMLSRRASTVVTGITQDRRAFEDLVDMAHHTRGSFVLALQRKTGGIVVEIGDVLRQILRMCESGRRHQVQHDYQNVSHQDAGTKGEIKLVKE